MNLYLMRHAIAQDFDGVLPDSQRALSKEGREKLDRVVHSLKKLEVECDVLIYSPYLRTRQTAAVLAQALGLAPQTLLESENLAPAGLPLKLFEQINALESAKNVWLVGHEPTLGQLIGLLTAGDTSLGHAMKKAGVCKLSVEQLVYGRCARLEWFLPPALLLAM